LLLRLQAKLVKKGPYAQYSSLARQGATIVWGDPAKPSTYPRGERGMPSLIRAPWLAVWRGMQRVCVTSRKHTLVLRRRLRCGL
jgi:hypothetical protein